MYPKKNPIYNNDIAKELRYGREGGRDLERKGGITKYESCS